MVPATVVVWLTLAGSASAFTVNVIGDGAPDACDASCTLRDAMTLANSTPGADVIDFAIPGAGTHQISPGSALPAITEQVSIDGTTQPGWAQDALVIEIDGEVTGPAVDGLFVNNAVNVNIEGLAINNFKGSGILTSAGSSGATILGNFIGSGFDGTSAGSGNEGNGIDLGGNNHVVGNGLPSGLNVISGNGTLSAGTHGIKVSGNTDAIKGNHIGVDRTGADTIPNVGSGVDLADEGNIVGGNGSGEGNVISGNTEDGILIEGSDSNTIRGNRIGTDAAGATDRGNGGHGINIQSSIGSDDNHIGGLAVGEGNVDLRQRRQRHMDERPERRQQHHHREQDRHRHEHGGGCRERVQRDRHRRREHHPDRAEHDRVQRLRGSEGRGGDRQPDHCECPARQRGAGRVPAQRTAHPPTPNDLGDPDLFGNNRQNYP